MMAASVMMLLPIFVGRLVQGTVSGAILFIFVRLVMIRAVNPAVAMMAAVGKRQGSSCTEYQRYCKDRCGDFAHQFMFHNQVPPVA